MRNKCRIAFSLACALAGSCRFEADLAGPRELQTGLIIDNLYWIAAEADATVRRDLANENNGNGMTLVLDKDARGRALIRSNKLLMESVVGLGTLSAAWIEVAIRGADGRTPPSGESLAAHPLTTAWTESGATWKCAMTATPRTARPTAAEAARGRCRRRRPTPRWRAVPRPWGRRRAASCAST